MKMTKRDICGPCSGGKGPALGTHLNPLTVEGKLHSARHYLKMHSASLQASGLIDDSAGAIEWLIRAVEQIQEEISSRPGTKEP